MTYQTPELLLVGAAQQLVLEPILTSNHATRCFDDNAIFGDALSDSQVTW